MDWTIPLLIFIATVPAFFVKIFFPKTEVQFVLCLWRTQRGKQLLDSLAKAWPSFWRWFADIGLIFAFGVIGAAYLMQSRTVKRVSSVFIFYLIFLSYSFVYLLPYAAGILPGVPLIFQAGQLLVLYIFGFGIFSIYGLAEHALDIMAKYLLGMKPTPGVAPIIPGVQVPGVQFYLPIHAIVSLIILLVVHEIAHGILARSQGFRVKSLGLLTAGLLPIGAFTEPDEKQMKRGTAERRLRVFTSGSMANFAAAIVFVLLFTGFYVALSPGMVAEQRSALAYYNVTAVGNGTPAYGIIQPGMKLYNVSSDRTPFALTEVATEKGTFTFQRNSAGLIGVTLDPIFSQELSLGYWLQKYFLEILDFTWELNILIGAINFLPFAIFDGARIFEDVFAFYSRRMGIRDGKTVKKIVRATTYLLLALLIINALPLFF